MILKGLLVVASGFIFIFSSGIPMRMISRFRPDYKRESMYWGMGIWAITFFLSTFLQNFIKQIVSGGQASTDSSSLLTYLLGDVITTFLLQIGMLLFLRHRLNKDEAVDSNGLALGFGIGMIAHVFTGLSEIGVGVNMIFHKTGSILAEGNVQAGTIANIANASFFNLFVSSLSTILFRVALLTVSAVQGYLVAGAVKGKSKRFWAGIILYIIFTWGALLLEVLLGEENTGQIIGVTSSLTSILTSIYYFAMTFFCYRWLSKELQASSYRNLNKRSNK
jgi:hypothetical protein